MVQGSINPTTGAPDRGGPHTQRHFAWSAPGAEPLGGEWAKKFLPSRARQSGVVLSSCTARQVGGGLAVGASAPLHPLRGGYATIPRTHFTLASEKHSS
jgi:hypothetical protein